MMMNTLFLSICLFLVISSVQGKSKFSKKDSSESSSSTSESLPSTESSESFDAPLVTRKPLNLKCKNSFIDTLLAVRQTIEHYGIDLLQEIGWDFDLHESLHTQLRPTRTLLINADAIQQIVETDPTALSFLPIRVGIYLDADGDVRMVFQDSNHFLSSFDVYEASAALEQLDRILWKLADSAECELRHHGVDSTDGSTTYALIRTEQAEILEALELRAEGLPGLAVSCGHCIDQVDYDGSSTTDLEVGFSFLQTVLAEEYPVPFDSDIILAPEGDLLSDESRYAVIALNNDYLNYYLLKSAGQEASGFLPVSVAIYYEEQDSEESITPVQDVCVTTLGTEYFQAAYGCPLPAAFCQVQESFFLLPKNDDAGMCDIIELPLGLEDEP